MSPSENTSKPLTLSTVLEEEYVELHGGRPFNHEKDATEEQRLEAIFKAIHALKLKRSALCLSGGGIRSATFCFGILQGLARCNLLQKFDYLSTVSGGGYIGSWLTAWIHREGAEKVYEKLKAPPKSKTEPEPKEISHLRAYSNYLSPRLGFLSADTWTLAAIYIRNLFLNWLVLLPVLLAVLLIPRIYVSLIRQDFGTHINGIFNYVPPPHVPDFVIYSISILGLILGAMALAYMGSHRPSLRELPVGLDEKKVKTPEDLRRFLRWCMVPLILATILLTLGRAWYLTLYHNPLKPTLSSNWVLWQYGVGGAGLLGLGWIITFIYVRGFFGPKVFKNFVNKRKARLLELIVVLITGFLGGGLLWLSLVPEKIQQILPTDRPERYACFDGPRLMLVFLFMGILSNGIGSRSTSDEDREWWARAGAWVLITIVVWVALNSLVLYGPEMLSDLWNFQVRPGAAIVPSLGIISGFVTILFAISSKTPANDRQAEKAGRLTTIMDYAVKIAAPMFVLFLVVVLSFGTDALIRLIKHLPSIYDQQGKLPEFPPLNSPSIIRHSSFLFLFCLLTVMGAISFLMSRCIDVNQFSLHSMYRNRLVRAYLGASNQKNRKATANPFTGFDPNDNVTVSDLWPNKEKSHKDAGKPLHLVNMTWNLVGGKNLAWQHRKATTFTVSPLHCGNYIKGYRRSKDYGGEPDPISLGTALSISGAAVSPNMGYYSSSAVTFLMTLFNARLGWWLGNPVKPYCRNSSPESALKAMIDEAFGKTEDDKNFMYLSDGGHFENLGLYEMVLRRCHYIFVVDASSDPKYKFENLGNAIRRIRVDLGITIEIRGIVNYSGKKETPGPYCALGDILYTGVNEAQDGVLIYIKPALRGVDEPTDIVNYARANVEFPQESIGDQFFSEEQFESYRVLGLHAIEQIFKKDWSKNKDKDWLENKDFGDLKSHVEAYIKRSQNIK